MTDEFKGSSGRTYSEQEAANKLAAIFNGEVLP